MIKAAIVGASGYTGAELCRILADHPHVQISAVTSRQHAQTPIAEIFPHLRNKISLICEEPDIEKICLNNDIIFTAVPHKTAMEIVPTILNAGKKVIDLSADFRLKDVSVYEHWYQKHTAPDYIEQATYGLPELYREAIAAASLVANPGCYPTSVLLALAPLLENSAILPQSIIIDSKSGTSGAGRGANVATLFCEVNDGFRPYKVGDHRHTPEIEQEVNLLSPEKTEVSFTPHLLPLSRGILSTIYATLNGEIDTSKINDMYSAKYEDEPFIRLLEPPALPATQYVRGSNFCDISFRVDERTNRIIIMSAIDNIVKGAAGQAIQN
nr:N-acetyl-gamma-glutamyl-phosphate reductase [Desulfocapsaceae bacterium]